MAITAASHTIETESHQTNPNHTRVNPLASVSEIQNFRRPPSSTKPTLLFTNAATRLALLYSDCVSETSHINEVKNDITRAHESLLKDMNLVNKLAKNTRSNIVSEQMKFRKFNNYEKRETHTSHHSLRHTKDIYD